MMLRILMPVLLSLLSACASYIPVNESPAPVERSEPARPGTPVLVGPPRPESVPEQSPVPASRQSVPATASSTLLASVDAAMAAGDFERAAAVSERALRISPRDAVIWYRLANIRYQQQRYADARGLARRALSYAAGDATLQQQVNDLLTRLDNQ
ncbi:hypothetical protein PHACT_04045 [Pseudohongiella acticola]|jgi:tetratricopeptide (TPR) repeat protein|uniref:Uncharacterized protein n=1 Tax=Pseudohongiella acticola TaxID=1524254 RepID=A0A1E8CJ51_9GAMM|nr:tetratricopeptide repeat protein [Pseudohongiella acticola]OFE12409.1 hypothetical protein PHACT_04045 [Pseudohongiella acticola]